MQSVEAKKPGDTLRDVEVEALAEEVIKRIKDTLTYIKPEAPVKKVVDTSLDCARLAS